jgi:hypothetical protein
MLNKKINVYRFFGLAAIAAGCSFMKLFSGHLAATSSQAVYSDKQVIRSKLQALKLFI